MSTPARLYFVVGSAGQIGRYESLEVNRDWAVFRRGWINSIVQTCLLLQARGVDACFSTVPRADGINIRHADTAEMADQQGCFIVGVLADWARLPFPAHLTVVQNQAQAAAELSRHWLPHWPLPGLAPRDEKRAGVDTVAYAGHVANLGLEPHLLAESCRGLGLRLRLLGLSKAADFSAVDILVGLRSCDRETHDGEPASKLVNGWLAGIPLSAATIRPSLRWASRGAITFALAAGRSLKSRWRVYGMIPRFIGSSSQPEQRTRVWSIKTR